MPDLSKEDNDRVDDGIVGNDDPPQSDNKQEKKESFAKTIGPGVITGPSDDDPSGIATYSQAGAQFGLGMLWMVLFQYQLITAI